MMSVRDAVLRGSKLAAPALPLVQRKIWNQSTALMASMGDVRMDSAGLQVPRAAIVRKVPETFANALSMEKTSAPINVELAKQQHAAYVNVLNGLVQEVIELPADNAFPDCPFVEDTAVVIGSRALITCPGAPSRRGEVGVVRDALRSLGVQTAEVQSPSLIDGGDVLYAGGMLFVGKSRRTNDDGIMALAATFEGIPVVPIEVPQSLHLKTVLSSVGLNVLAVEDTTEAKIIFSAIQSVAPYFKSIIVSPAGAANTLLVGNTVVYPSGYGKSFESTYDTVASKVVPVNISEFHKADGGLTCLSIFVS
ncbi:unnamed protein product [Calypogeia fissa]